MIDSKSYHSPVPSPPQPSAITATVSDVQQINPSRQAAPVKGLALLISEQL